MRHNTMKRWVISALTPSVALGFLAQGQAVAASDRAVVKSGALTQAAAVDLYNRYRKALVDGDYNTFLNSIYAPGKPADLPRVPQDQVPEQFTMMKGFILESSPDLSAAKILRFSADDRAAILVTQVDLQNSDYITLRAVMFAADRGSWKLLTKVQDDTFPRISAERDKKSFQNELENNASLQLAAAAAEAESIKVRPAAPAPPPSAAESRKDHKPAAKGQRPPETGTASAKERQGPTLSQAFNDSPQHKAIVKELTAKGRQQMLQTASSITMVQVDSVSLIDDTWKGQDRRKRDVNLVCSELVDNEWKDYRLTLVYEYDDKKGWQITGQAKARQPSPKTDQGKRASAPPAEPAKPESQKKAAWANAKTAIDQIVRHIGGNPEPVFVVFGTAGGRFIQFHYVTERAGKDIQAVDWLDGKLRGPQASRLARACPPIAVAEIDYGQVSRIFDDMSGKAKAGDMISVNLSRRSSKGCKDPIWQGVATSSKHSLTVTYSMDGKQTDIQDYSF